jgi:hypothetical protein
MIDGFRISSNLKEMNVDAIHAFLSRSDGAHSLLEERNLCMQ